MALPDSKDIGHRRCGHRRSSSRAGGGGSVCYESSLELAAQPGRARYAIVRDSARMDQQAVLTKRPLVIVSCTSTSASTEEREMRTTQRPFRLHALRDDRTTCFLARC